MFIYYINIGWQTKGQDKIIKTHVILYPFIIWLVVNLKDMSKFDFVLHKQNALMLS